MASPLQRGMWKDLSWTWSWANCTGRAGVRWSPEVPSPGAGWHLILLIKREAYMCSFSSVGKVFLPSWPLALLSDTGTLCVLCTLYSRYSFGGSPTFPGYHNGVILSFLFKNSPFLIPSGSGDLLSVTLWGKQGLGGLLFTLGEGQFWSNVIWSLSCPIADD